MLHMLQVGWSQWASTVDIHNILLGKHHVLYTLPVDVRLREILRGLCVYVCVFEREAQRDGVPIDWEGDRETIVQVKWNVSTNWTKC